MNGYSVFLGPFAGIMITDVSPLALSVSSYSKDLSVFSTGSSTSAALTCRQCTGLADVIGTLPAS